MDNTYGCNGEKHAWIGLDPGVTTGWCLVSDGFKVLGSGNIPATLVRESVDTLVRGAHRKGYKLSVACEMLPRAGGVGDLAGTLNRVLADIAHIVTGVYDLPVLEIMPGEWKPSRMAKSIDPRDLVEGPLTQHQKDAIRMTFYAIDRAARRRHAV